MTGRIDRGTGIVLAGGRSSRMGRAKAFLPFDGRPLIEQVVATLHQLFRQVVVVSAPGQELPALDATLISDEVAYQGPVSGIRWGLEAAEQDVCFVTSCDSVFLDPVLVSYLLSRAGAHDVVVPFWEGRLQPLHAVYRRSVRGLLAEQLTRGELRPVSLFEKVRTCRVEEDDIRRIDAEGWSFFNMNTPEEYARACEHWREVRHGQGDADAPREGLQCVHCTVELLGVARLLARRSEVPLTMEQGATFSEVYAALAQEVPSLVGRVIDADRRMLLDGYACNVNGLAFVRAPGTPVAPGDNILILSADAGG